MPAHIALPRRAMRRQARPTARGVNEAVPTTHDQLVALLDSLTAIRDRLLTIDLRPLTPDQRKALSDQLDAAELAMSRVIRVMLEGIAQEFEATIPELQIATAKLEDDLVRLQSAVDVINTVAATLGVLQQIITLFR